MLLVVSRFDLKSLTARPLLIRLERVLYLDARGLGLYRYYPDLIRFPQCLGVLGIPGVLRTVRLPVVRYLGKSQLFS